MESLVTWFTSTLGAHISREAIVFIISLFPILELRGGILASSLLDVTMWKGILISAVGNILPIPFILFFIVNRYLKFSLPHTHDSLRVSSSSTS